MARKEGAVAENETAGETAPAAEKAPRVTQKYKRTDKAPEKELRGQGKETLDALDKATEPVTAEEVAAACAYPGSRQDKVRVAGFYLSQFKKKGLVALAE